MSFLSGFLESQMMRAEYISWLEGIKGERAVDKKVKHCLRCGHCCAKRPCIPTPNELRSIAKYLKMSVKDCVAKYFVMDRIGGTTTNIIFPAKDIQTDITGTFVEWRRTYDEGYCIFYDKTKKLCKIYAVRPKDADDTYCWKENNGSVDETLKTWENVDFSEFSE